MKYLYRLLRVIVAIVLTMVVSVLPHHHHHGDAYWVFDECLTHEHTETCEEEQTHDLPCNEHSCYLQAMKLFTQVERMDKIHHLFLDFVLPQEITITPYFYYFDSKRITLSSYPLHSGNLQKHYLRGPPVC